MPIRWIIGRLIGLPRFIFIDRESAKEISTSRGISTTSTNSYLVCLTGCYSCIASDSSSLYTGQTCLSSWRGNRTSLRTIIKCIINEICSPRYFYCRSSGTSARASNRIEIFLSDSVCSPHASEILSRRCRTGFPAIVQWIIIIR